MLNRVFLYICRNFGKMLSSFIMFTVMLSLIGTLAYVYATVNNRVDDVNLVRHNYILDYEQLYSNENDSSKMEFKSFRDIYSKMKELDGLEAYMIDTNSDNLFIIAEDTIDPTVFNQTSFQIVDDEKHIDFVTKAVEITAGELNAEDVLISEEYAEKNGISIGDEIEITGYSFMEGGFSLGTESEVTYSYVYPVKVSGFYFKKEKNEEANVESIYMSLATYDKMYNEIVAKMLEVDSYMMEYLSSEPDFIRVLAQYDNEKSIKELDAFIEENYDYLYTVNSAKKAEESKEPLKDFGQIILILTIIVTLISIVGIYLNMYLKLDKRRSEFIALLSFGINSFKLSIQVFLEQLLFALLSLPAALLFTSNISKTIIEIVKMYYIVVIDENAGNEEMYGGWLDYISLSSSDVVNFESANLLFVMLIALAVIIVSLLILSIVEVSRRYMNVKKV